MRRLVAGLSKQKCGIKNRPAHVGFVLEKLELD
jgi:hypothetical protein